MSDLKLSGEQWEMIRPLLPLQPRTGRRRKHDRQVFNSLIYRLKRGVRYKDIPKSGDYAAKSTVLLLARALERRRRSGRDLEAAVESTRS